MVKANSDHPDTPSRRALLTGSTAALLAGAAAIATTAAQAAVASPDAAGDDAELVALAVSYATANADIRRLEALPHQVPDETYKPLDAQRFSARVRGEQLPAAGMAGVQAKAAIIVGELDLTGAGIESGTPADLAASLARAKQSRKATNRKRAA